MDEHEEGKDEYNQILDVGCDIDDFLVIIDAYVKHGGNINSLYEFADELNATKNAKPDSVEVFFMKKDTMSNIQIWIKKMIIVETSGKSAFLTEI